VNGMASQTWKHYLPSFNLKQVKQPYRLRSVGAARRHWSALGYREVAQSKRGGRSAHFVRDYNGFEVHYFTKYKATPGKIEMTVFWSCPLPGPAQFGSQVIEAGLADKSLLGRVSDALDRTKYNWEPLFTERIETGDAQLDERFAILGTDLEAARRWLLDPSLKAAILSLKHVDLTVSSGEVRFEDPFSANQLRVNGQALVAVHNRIAEILTRTAVAATQMI
jgi:hypothetical protein